MKYIKLFEQDEWWLDGKKVDVPEEEIEYYWVSSIEMDGLGNVFNFPKRMQSTRNRIRGLFPEFDTEEACQNWCDENNLRRREKHRRLYEQDNWWLNGEKVDVPPFPYKIGDRVVRKGFGAGTIIEIFIEEGEDADLLIQFDREISGGHNGGNGGVIGLDKHCYWCYPEELEKIPVK